MEYIVAKTAQRAQLNGAWNDSPWCSAGVLPVNNFLSQSKSRHPRTEARALYHAEGLFVFFRVFDKYVRCVRTEYQSSVCKDSCVEFFVEPRADRGYFNFEINCGGALLLYFQEQLPGPPGARIAYKRHNVPRELGEQVAIYHSMPKVVEPEIEADTEWRIEYFIPWAVFERYLGPLGSIAGQTWRANFYKCGDATSHPHWASWAPMGSELNFHLPQYFAQIIFAL